MREFTPMTVMVVDSEPGDMTHYQYIISQQGDDYSIAPLGNSFRYPQKLNYWEIKGAGDEEIIEIAEREKCNPWTVREVINAIKELRETT